MAMILVARADTEAEAEALTLALSAAGIPSRAARRDGLWEIEVHAIYALRAIDALRDLRPESGGESLPTAEHAPSPLPGLVAALILIVAHACSAWRGHEETVRRAGSSGYLLRHGEFHRCVTALFVHADLNHLVSNAAAMAVLASGVAAGTGTGVGALLVILAGGLGNALSGYAQGSYRLSIGASTAVFAAVGVLAARQCFQRLRRAAGRLKAWVPLGAALALLSMLGAGPHTDLSAHLCGLVAGCTVGGIHAALANRPAPRAVQISAAATAALLVAVAWHAACVS